MDVDEQADPIDDTNSDETTAVVVGGQQDIATSVVPANAEAHQDEGVTSMTVGGGGVTMAISPSNTERFSNLNQSACAGIDVDAVIPSENGDLDDIMCGSVSSENDGTRLVWEDEVNAMSAAHSRLSAIEVVNQDGVLLEQQEEQQIENAGIDPNYPLVLVQRVSMPSINNANNDNSSIMVQDNIQMNGDGSESIMNEYPANRLDTFDNPEIAAAAVAAQDIPCENGNTDHVMPNDQHSLSGSVTSETDGSSLLWENEVTATSAAHSRLSSIEEANQDGVLEQQEEQQIENAGIDPNYPLVLVQRVSLPSINNPNNDNSPSMVQDNVQMAGDGGESIMDEYPENRLDIFDDPEIAAAVARNAAAAPAVAGNDSDDSDDGIISMSEDDEDEAAFLENPNLREFRNQFVVIRNMIAQTRHSMAEAEANIGPSAMLPRNTLMQRFRRILFILNNRRRRLIRLGMSTPDEENPEGEANAEMEAVNEEIANENNENSVNDENNMTIEQEEEMTENAVRFDTNLPGEHSYLGSNMSRVSGVNYLDDHQYVKLRLFIHQHVLFPGEVLPFMVHSSTTIIEGEYDAQNGILFGLCFPSLTSNNAANIDGGSGSDKSEQLLYGVTCQIYELGTDDRGNTLIKSRALQRFVTKVNDLTVPLEYINSHPRMKCFGYVKILPDIYLPEPLKYMNMGSMNRFRDNKSMMKSYRRFQAATTPWPVHVYETHNITTFIDKARTQLAQHKIDTMPTDPTQLSYWLLRNLHLPENMLKSVFLANTVNTRLKLISSTFKEDAIFGCRSCGTQIANCRELFAMSKHGVQSQYCNSAGYIHETNTVYQVNRHNILYNGSPSTKFSWFPGYQWHIIVCKICEHHLGWEFKAVEPNLVPKQFFGISSSSVRVRSSHERSDEQAQTQHAYYNFIRLMHGGVHIEE